jgi:hypothetical protein
MAEATHRAMHYRGYAAWKEAAAKEEAQA